MSEFWQEVQYPQQAFMPPGSEAEWVEPVFFDGWENLSVKLHPEYPLEVLYGAVHNYPYFFYEGEPTHWFDPSMLAAVQQQEHQLPNPVLPIEYRYWIESASYFGEPSEWFEHSMLAAIQQQEHQSPDPVLPIEYRYWMESFFYTRIAATSFSPEWMAAIDQLNHQGNASLPEYSIVDIYGDIANMPYNSYLVLAGEFVHFGPNADDAFRNPTTFSLLEGPDDFEVRTPI